MFTSTIKNVFSRSNPAGNLPLSRARHVQSLLLRKLLGNPLKEQPFINNNYLRVLPKLNTATPRQFPSLKIPANYIRAHSHYNFLSSELFINDQQPRRPFDTFVRSLVARQSKLGAWHSDLYYCILCVYIYVYNILSLCGVARATRVEKVDVYVYIKEKLILRGERERE